jgi:hypothetical protein
MLSKDFEWNWKQNNNIIYINKSSKKRIRNFEKGQHLPIRTMKPGTWRESNCELTSQPKKQI